MKVADILLSSLNEKYYNVDLETYFITGNKKENGFMGTMYGFKCMNCGLEAKLGEQQPYYIMSGSITDKYCPKIGKIISVFTKYYDNITKISCQDDEWQREFGNLALCRNCKAECLQDLEMLAASDDSEFCGYKCPRCGSDLNWDCVLSFSDVD